MEERSGTPPRDVLAGRVGRAGIAVPRAEAVVVDLASDPPLGRSVRATALEESGRIVEGLGAAMLLAGAGRGVLAVRDGEVEAAMRSALAERGVERGPGPGRERVPAGVLASVPEGVAERVPEKVIVARAPEVWPSIGVERDLGGPYAWRLGLDALLDLEAAAFERSRVARRVTVAGIVARPQVLVLDGPATAGELVERCGGVREPGDALSWVALDGGAFGGRLRDRAEPIERPLLLVLAAAHPLVARARTPLADHLLRAASACEGCRACTEVCPVALDGVDLRPDEILKRVSLPERAEGGTRLASAAACVGCGVCDTACPSGLSPSVIVSALRRRLDGKARALPRGAPHPDRAGRRTSIQLLLLRAGLLSDGERADGQRR